MGSLRRENITCSAIGRGRSTGGGALLHGRFSDVSGFKLLGQSPDAERQITDLFGRRRQCRHQTLLSAAGSFIAVLLALLQSIDKSGRVVRLLLQRAATKEKTTSEISGVFGGKPPNAYLDTP